MENGTLSSDDMPLEKLPMHETVVLLCRKGEQADRHIVVDYEPQGRHMEKRK